MAMVTTRQEQKTLRETAANPVQQQAEVAEKKQTKFMQQADGHDHQQLCLVVDLDNTLLHSVCVGGMLRKEYQSFCDQLVQSDQQPPSELHMLNQYYVSRPGAMGREEYLSLCQLVQSEHRPSDLHMLEYSINEVGNLLIAAKLRPFVHQFLKEASTMFKLYMCTMGSRPYAEAVVRQLLDPSDELFGGRIICRDDILVDQQQQNKCTFIGSFLGAKNLDLIPFPASHVIILDDFPSAWHEQHHDNLIVIDAYHFFDCLRSSASAKQDKQQQLHHKQHDKLHQHDIPEAATTIISDGGTLHAADLSGEGAAPVDEIPANGALANVLKLLRSIHHAFFNISTSDAGDHEQHAAAAHDYVNMVPNITRLNVSDSTKAGDGRLLNMQQINKDVRHILPISYRSLTMRGVPIVGYKLVLHIK